MLRSEHRASNSSTPSIHNLPPEIICIIFELLRDTLSRFMKVPFLLSLVCPRWRSIALACPSLWTRVSIQSLCDKDRVAACIERSGRSLLTIDISIPDDELFENECFQTPIQLCVQHAHRWHHLSVHISHTSCLKLCNRGRLELPELVQLTVRCRLLDTTSPYDEASRFIGALKAPKLSIVEYRGRPHSNHFSMSSLPWRAIKDVTFDACYGHWITTALQHLTSLDKCVIESPISYSLLGQSVASPLRVLELGFVARAIDLSMILLDVSLPNLQILRIERSCPDLREVLVPIISNLTALTLVDNWSFSDIDILKMLENAPSLQSFALWRDVQEEATIPAFRDIAAPIGPGDVLTKLQTITFAVIPTINEGSFVRMISARAGTLKEIEVGLVRRTLKEVTLLSLANLAVFRMERTFRRGGVGTVLLTR